MAQSNTENDQPVNPLEDQRNEQIESLQKAISDMGIENGLFIFSLPEDEDGTFRTLRFGHFYDSLQMISEYCKKAKKRVMDDLEGIA